jgi:thiol-disulfide isomerase/thioredoxin
MATTPTPPPSPDALLLLAPGCAYCPKVLEALTELVKDGALGTLEVVNVVERPARARELGVRSVPWTRIGPFILEGLQSKSELRQWAERAARGEGMSEYVARQLKGNRLARVQRLLQHEPRWAAALLPLIEDPDTAITVRLGVGAVIEDLADSDILAGLTAALGRLSTHRDHRVRSDACHYLGLTGSDAAVPYLRPRLQDEDAEVREIAAESLERLGHAEPV